jgi:DNA polymerase III alpha subunit (gram-positive type)
MEYTLYVADVETTGLDSRIHDVIEISLLRLNDNIQKTWSLRPLNVDQAQPDALRINGHKLEDLKLQTKFGRDTYREPSEVLIEIENWIAEDGTPAGKRILVGQNINFDKDMFEQLWKKCNASDTYPFGRRILDTMQIEFFLDFCKGTFAEGYSLNNLIKKYGVKNEKAHTAEADVKATREVFDKQVDIFKKIMKTNA